MSKVTGSKPIDCWYGKADEGGEAVPFWRRSLIGQSPAIRELCEVIKLIASKRVTVLISGETGTGKEVVARAIHGASTRFSQAMVAVNCTALPSSLVESELFGHAKGAFTGAHSDRMGRFGQANRGTIFLDEIGDLPLEAQAKLLRVLQEQEFERVGSSETVRVDVRVIAASNVELDRAVQERRFREDLFYRLNVVPLHIPALRERREDIPLLVECFLEKIRVAESAAPKKLSDEALEFLMKQDWPGNVRQLEHTVQMAFALSGDRYLLGPQDFILRGREQSRLHTAAANPESVTVKIGPEGLDFDLAVGRFERSLLNQALVLSGGNKARAADLLRIKRTTLLAKMKAFDEREAADYCVR
jgi:transcriptional regulator with GAF, ATPase, and Fis domain